MIQPITITNQTDRHINPKEAYPTWGMAVDQSNTEQATAEDVEKAQTLIKTADILDSRFALSHAKKIQHYQGPTHPSREAILLRYERIDGLKTGLGDEHISATVDIKSGILLWMWLGF